MQAFRPDRTVKVVTAVASVAFFGFAILASLLLVGLPVLKVVAGDDPDWTIGVTVPVTVLDPDARVLTRWGEAPLEVEDVQGSLRLPIAMLPWWLFAGLWAHAAVALGLMLTFLHHLRRIFQRVRAGAPFDSGNAVRLRWLALLALAIALLGGVAELGAAFAVQGNLASDDITVPTSLSLDLSSVFFALVLLSLAEIFRRGAELEDEQALVV